MPMKFNPVTEIIVNYIGKEDRLEEVNEISLLSLFPSHGWSNLQQPLA